MNTGFILGLIKAAEEVSAPLNPSSFPHMEPPVKDLSNFKFLPPAPVGSFLKKDNNLQNAFSVDMIGDKLPARKPIAYLPNSLSVNSHGMGSPGNFKFIQDPSSSMFNDIQPETQTSIPEIAKTLGPATNNIHNFSSVACNAEGGLTPQCVQKYFPNVTNVVQTPKFNYGLVLPSTQSITNQTTSELGPMHTGSPEERSYDEEVASDSAQLRPGNTDYLDAYLSALNGSKVLRPSMRTAEHGYVPPKWSPAIDIPHQYLLQGTNWVDKGRQYY